MNTKAVLLNDTSDEGHLVCPQVVQNIKTLCAKNGIEILGSFTRKNVQDRCPELLKQTQKTDFIIINGEGTLHHSPVIGSELLSFGNKPIILINAVWEKMFLVSKFLDKFFYICVRESKSYEEIIKIVPSKKVQIVPDTIFYTVGEYAVQKIGFGDSVMGFVKEELSREINFFPLQKGEKVPDLQAYINWMKSLDLYVTGRFHGVCLAMMLQIPFLAIPSNSHKIEGLLADCGCSELLILDKEEIPKKRELAKQFVGTAYQYAEKAKKQIDDSFVQISSIARAMK
jgi:polysaccharide pyruvyl transferase WcaK-like protein